MSIAAHETDVAIIGAGPAGLFAVFQCGMLGLKTSVIDALPEIGGQCTALYPDKPIFDIPSQPLISGADLVAQLERQVAPFEPVIHLNDHALACADTSDGGFLLTTARGRTIAARAVIIAGGAGAFGPNKPPLENIGAFEGKSVFYMVRNKADFAGRRVVIAGGGDSAVDWALALSGIAASVSVIHRRDQFRAAPEMVARMRDDDRIELVIPYQLKGISGDAGMITHVHAATLEGHEKAIEADCLLAFYGLAAKLGPLAEWGIDIDTNRIVVDPATMQTSRKGIFAIGDMARYEGKLNLILTGFAEGAQAAHAAYAHINPGKALHVEYSTSKGVPGTRGSDISTIAA